MLSLVPAKVWTPLEKGIMRVGCELISALALLGNQGPVIFSLFSRRCVIRVCVLAAFGERGRVRLWRVLVDFQLLDSASLVKPSGSSCTSGKSH
jgi:hypothetical protein